MDAEISFVAAVLDQGIERRCIVHQLPRAVEDLDRAKVLCGGGVVEQDQLPDLLADLRDLRHHHGAGDRTQRQVEQFDVAADIGVDAGSEVFQRLPG